MDRLPEKLDSKFRYVLLAAGRAEQLMRGARPKIDSRPRKPTVMAMDEVNRDLVAWEYGPAPEPEPPQVEAVEEAPNASTPSTDEL